jgi:hypothetical protein
VRTLGLLCFELLFNFTCVNIEFGALVEVVLAAQIFDDVDQFAALSLVASWFSSRSHSCVLSVTIGFASFVHIPLKVLLQLYAWLEVLAISHARQSSCVFGGCIFYVDLFVLQRELRRVFFKMKWTHTHHYRFAELLIQFNVWVELDRRLAIQFLKRQVVDVWRYFSRQFRCTVAVGAAIHRDYVLASPNVFEVLDTLSQTLDVWLLVPGIVFRFACFDAVFVDLERVVDAQFLSYVNLRVNPLQLTFHRLESGVFCTQIYAWFELRNTPSCDMISIRWQTMRKFNIVAVGFLEHILYFVW